MALDPEHSLARSPEFAALEQLGSLTCLWQNSVPPPPWEDRDPDHASARLQVLPDAKEPWERYLQTYGPQSTPSPYGDSAIGPQCSGAEHHTPGPPVHTCQLDALVGSYWVQLLLTGVSGGSAQSDAELTSLARDVTDPLMNALASAEPPVAEWTPPSHQPLDCDTVMTDQQAMSVTGVTGLVVGQRLDGPKVGQFLHSLEQTGAKRCHLLIGESDQAIAHIAFLPGGGWAFRDRSDAWVHAGDAALIDLDGARIEEQFTEECPATEADCRIDMLVGENWLQVLTYAHVPGKISQPEGVDMLHVRSQTQALAETVLANLHAAE